MPTAPCPDVCSPWASVEDLEACNLSDCAELDCIEEYLLAASNELFALTGRQWPGSCEDTVRPTSRRSCHTWRMWGLSACSCSGSSVCSPPPRITLSADIITGITQVLIDGAIFTDFAVHEDNGVYWLVRTDGGSWPACQDLTQPATEPDTFEVTYTYGQMPPINGKHAAMILACARAKKGAGLPCEIPERVTAITEQGVSMTLVNPLDDIKEGFTGIASVDAFIGWANPHHAMRDGFVVNPDLFLANRNARIVG